MKAAAFALAAVLAGAATARAQDFAPPLAAGPDASPLVALERALPAAAPGFSICGATATVYGLPDLATRAIGVGAGFANARAALGLSQTGTPALGWTSFALAVGGAGSAGGAALRLGARRDRDVTAQPAAALGPGIGLEAGAGAWFEAAPEVTVWASAPQLWARGTAPPLARPLELGVRATFGTVAWWGAVAAADERSSARVLEGERALGAACGAPALGVWAEFRDRPLRGALGIRAERGGLGVAARVDSHPVLGESLRLALTLGAGAGP